MTKRLKDTPGLSNYVKKNDSIDKVIKVFDRKTLKEIFKKQSEVANNMERFRPIYDNERFSKRDINMAKRIMAGDKNFQKGGRIGLKMGSKCKLATKGKGRAYGKNS